MPTLNFNDLAALPEAASAPGVPVGTNYLAAFGVTVSANANVRNWTGFGLVLPGFAGYLRSTGSGVYTVTIDPAFHYTGLTMSWRSLSGFYINVTGRNGVSTENMRVLVGYDWAVAQVVPLLGVDDIANFTIQALDVANGGSVAIAEMIFTGTGPPPQPAPDIWPGRCEAWPAGDKFR